MLNMPKVKNSAEDILKYFFSFSPEKRFWHFMQIVSRSRQFAWNGKTYFLEKEKNISLSSVQLAQSGKV